MNLFTILSSLTNLEFHNIAVTPKVVKKVVTNLDSSKASGPDFAFQWWLVLKNCQPELSRTLWTLRTLNLKVIWSHHITITLFTPFIAGSSLVTRAGGCWLTQQWRNFATKKISTDLLIYSKLCAVQTLLNVPRFYIGDVISGFKNNVKCDIFSRATICSNLMPQTLLKWGYTDFS